MAAKKPTKKRPNNKSSKNGRFKFYIGITLLAILLSLLIYISLNNKTQKDSKTGIAQKTEQINVQNSKKISQKEQKNITKKFKFDKDENLSKIFIDPKSIDETQALSYKKSQEKNFKADNKKNTQTQNDTNKTSKDYSQNPQESNKTKSKTTELDIIFNDKDQVKKELDLIKNSSHTPKDINKKQQNKTINKKEQEILHANKTKSAKLAIIIDDVATYSHANMIRSTGLKLTPSIFPATKNHPDTPKIAKSFGIFMIHLPMQAQNFSQPEMQTIMVNESIQSMQKKIKKIRADFPNAKFINNHTGSKFTSDLNSMSKAFELLRQEGFIFLDSRTTPDSKVKTITQKYGTIYFARDVFLDDSDKISDIKYQLERAITLAKKHGLAIAIGHPRKNTISVLKNSKQLLKDVELIYINEAYELLKQK